MFDLRIRSLFVIAFASAVAPAQIMVQTTAGGAGARAGNDSRIAMWPAALIASASDSGGQLGYSCSASCSASAGSTGQGISASAQATSSGLCGPPPFGFGMSANATVDCRARLFASAPVAGELGLQLTHALSGTIDVGADGIPEAISNGPIPIVVAPSGVEIQAAAWASALHPFSPGQNALASATFAAITTQLTTSGQPCEADLSAWASTYTNGTVTLAFRGWTSASGAAGFFVFGFTSQQIPIPPLGCVLATEILVPVFAPIDATGRARLDLTLGATLPPIACFVQFLAGRIEASGEVWRTSNRIAVRIP